jgi:hypothetical protein
MKKYDVQSKPHVVDAVVEEMRPWRERLRVEREDEDLVHIGREMA